MNKSCVRSFRFTKENEYVSYIIEIIPHQLFVLFNRK